MRSLPRGIIESARLDYPKFLHFVIRAPSCVRNK